MTIAAEPAGAPDSHRQDERRAMGVASGAHALHDGYTDLIYVMLPIWQSEFGLGFAALGLMKTVFSGALAGFQIPSSMLAERLGAPLTLALGTALAGFGYCLAGVSTGMTMLVVALFIGGLGASTQHPLASALIAQAFETVRYPILPRITRNESEAARQEILEIRHSSLFAPRDFDISPYFEVVKPTIRRGFDYRAMAWADRLTAEPAVTLVPAQAALEAAN